MNKYIFDDVEVHYDEISGKLVSFEIDGQHDETREWEKLPFNLKKLLVILIKDREKFVTVADLETEYRFRKSYLGNQIQALRDFLEPNRVVLDLKVYSWKNAIDSTQETKREIKAPSQYIATKKGYRWIYKLDSDNTVSSKNEIDESTYSFGEEYKDFMDDVKNHLRKFNDIKDLPEWEESEYKIALANVSLSRGQNSEIIANVKIPLNPWVAHKPEWRNCMELITGTDKSTRHPAQKEIQKFLVEKVSVKEKINVKNFPARFSQGGSLTILKLPKEDYYVEGKEVTNYKEEELQRFIIVSEKDDGAIHGRHLIPQSGLAEYEEDWLDPELVIIGETVEEIRIHSDKRWYVPIFPDEVDDSGNEKDYSHFRERVVKTINKRKKYLEEYRKNFKESIKKCEGMPDELWGSTKDVFDVKLIRLGKDKLQIKRGKDSRSFEGLLVIDPEYGAIDLMGAVEISIPKKLSQLKIYDGETHEKKMLSRNVYVFRDEELAKVLEGKKAKITSFFGCHEGHWQNGVEAILIERPLINPPLLGVAPVLLKNEFDINVSLHACYKKGFGKLGKGHGENFPKLIEVKNKNEN